ncbi:amino acid/amide ABC transporter membrane protein 1, HAAT family [Rhizobiales bacterium GAS191]|nr:amino acid/amide ABC transporter membrane protein 1, HAAT family [Rhizobiales bacterium GAS191]
MRSTLRNLAKLALLLAFLVVSLAPARAADRAELMTRFATENFNEIEAAVTALAASGEETAQTVISALAERRLFYNPADRNVVYKDEAGKTFAAATGAEIADPPSGLKPVRLNNRVRSSIEAALGSLTLLAADPGKRRSAADAVFKSRDPSALPALEAALAKESDPLVKRIMGQARAAIFLQKADAPEATRIDAVRLIRERGDQDALSLLRSIPADAPASVKEAAAAAIAAIESRLALWGTVQNAWYGLSLGSVLLLAAIGLAVTFGVMGVINMAHGEMVMLGAYTSFMIQDAMRQHGSTNMGLALALAVPAAFLVSGAAGIVIERGVIRFLYGRPLETLLATWGISLILQQAVRTGFGPTNREVDTPAFMSGAFDVGGMQITLNRLAIILFAIAVFVALQFVLRFTSFGLRTRAVTQNRRMASSMGIRTNWIDALTFGLGSGIAGLAGVALSQIDNVSPNLGQGYIIDSFLVVVFGGVGNLWGTLIAALSIGMANKFLEPFAGAVLGKIALLVFIILFIQKRPRGLFALKGRAIEA